MARPLLITLEKTNTPILIIDREGSIGLGLCTKLLEHYSVVFAGGREPQENKNLLFLPFGKQIPQIPTDTYWEIFYIVNSEKELRDILPSLSEKAKQDKAKLFIIGTRDVTLLHVIEYIYSQSKEAAIVVIGDVFGNMLTHRPNSIDNIFISSKVKKHVNLPGVGLSKIYPVLFEDVIIELLRISFTFTRKAKLYFLHTQYPMTSLGLAHLLQKENPMLKIDFKKDEQIEADDTLPIEGEYLLPENYPASEKLQKTYARFTEKQGAESIQEQEVVKSKEKRKFPSFIAVSFLTVIIFFLTLILLPLAFVAGGGLIGQYVLKQSLLAAQKGDITNAKKNLNIAKQAFSAVMEGLPVFSFEAGLVKKEDFVTSIENQAQLTKTAITDISNILAISDSLQQFSSAKSVGTNQKLSEGIASIKNLIVTAQEVTQDKLIAPEKFHIISTLQNAPSFMNTLDAIPTIFGSKNKQTYLVLFQNNAELRPGGGFIGSYGILQVDKGAITDFSIHDVYDADGQLKGHIEPPFAIRRYMQIVHLFLRDSNFDVDFSKDAFLEAFMYQQETGQKVDGVLAIDLSFVRDLLASVGQVYVSEYKETVTKDNLFILAENHSEKNFFPGSTQKGDFLRSTFNSIKDKLVAGKINYLLLLEGIVKAAQEKDILFAFANSSTQDLFTVNGLSSSLWDPRLEKPGSMNDFLGINEANIGINKVNYYVTRQVNQQVAIGNTGDITGKLTLSITNTSDGKWPGGPYKNYIRFVLPKDVDLTRIVIDGQEQKIVPAITDFLVYEKKGFVPPNGLEVEKTVQSGKTLFGFLTTILPSKTQSITIYYANGKVDLSQPVLTYSLEIFKQPGVESYPYTLVLQRPDSFKLLQATPNVNEQGDAVALQENIDTDKAITITLGKR